MKVAFDIGGVLSKYPDTFRQLVAALIDFGHEVYVITDMPDKEKTVAMLQENLFGFIPESNVHNADYNKYGELCKAVLLRKLKIDMFFDDFPGYLTEGCKVRLQVLPDPQRPYYHRTWKTDGSEGDFGRRIPTDENFD